MVNNLSTLDFEYYDVIMHLVETERLDKIIAIPYFDND